MSKEPSKVGIFQYRGGVWLEATRLGSCLPNRSHTPSTSKVTPSPIHSKVAFANCPCDFIWWCKRLIRKTFWEARFLYFSATRYYLENPKRVITVRYSCPFDRVEMTQLSSSKPPSQVDLAWGSRKIRGMLSRPTTATSWTCEQRRRFDDVAHIRASTDWSVVM